MGWNLGQMPPQIRLDYITPDQTAEILQMQSGVVTIGREPENGIVIDSEAVSRRHATILEAGNHWVFRDLGSTNGSWVNNVQIKPERMRLIRNGDVIQVANFAMKVSETHESYSEDESPVQLLVFFGDEYQGDFPLSAAQPSCTIGGDGQIKIEGESRQLAQINYSVGTGRIELVGGPTEVPVILNGLAVRGTSSLSDSDEVNIGGCRILISDLKAFRQRGVAQNWSPAAGSRDLMPSAGGIIPHVGVRPSDGWNGPAARKPSPRRFVFGQNTGDGDLDPLGTVAIPSQRLRSHTSYDSHPSQRFSGALHTEEDDAANAGGSEQRLVVVGGVMLVVLIVAVVLFLSFQI